VRRNSSTACRTSTSADAEAAAEWQRLCCLCDVVEPGRRRFVAPAAIWWLAPSLNGNPNQIFGHEKNKAIEIGTKWELFDRRLLVTAALFPDGEGKRA